MLRWTLISFWANHRNNMTHYNTLASPNFTLAAKIPYLKALFLTLMTNINVSARESLDFIH
jgi:hypothetical protein